MKFCLFSLFLILSFLVSANSFRSLSSVKAVKETYTASSKVKVDVNLILQIENKDFQNLPIIIKYRVNDVEFQDFLEIETVKRGVVKSINLKEGDYFEAGIIINSQDTLEVDQIRGSITFSEGVKSFSSADNKSYEFTGDLWRVKEAPLFRVVKKDDTEQKIKFTVTTDTNYPHDKLYLRIKVIHPKDGMKKISKTIVITDDEFLSGKSDSFEFVLEGVVLNSPGNFYFEVKHQHSKEWLNGVSSISYELLD